MEIAPARHPVQAVKGQGMPLKGQPFSFGNLFLQLKVGALNAGVFQQNPWEQALRERWIEFLGFPRGNLGELIWGQLKTQPPVVPFCLNQAISIWDNIMSWSQNSIPSHGVLLYHLFVLKYIDILNFEELKTHPYFKYGKHTTRHGNKCCNSIWAPDGPIPLFQWIGWRHISYGKSMVF